MTIPSAATGIILSERWRERLACPACRVPLQQALLNMPDPTAVSCVACGTRYAVERGVITFAPTSAFYEDHGFTHSGRKFPDGPIGRLALYYARYHYLYDIYKTVPPGAALVEKIGCEGGSRWLAARYDALGVDLSLLRFRLRQRSTLLWFRATSPTSL